MTRFAAALALASLASPGTRAEAIEGIAAVVGDSVILVSEVQERAGAALRQAAETQSAFIRDQQIREVLTTFLDQMITERLIEQEARTLMLTASEEEVDRALIGLQQQNGWDDLQLANQLERRGETMEQFREEMRIQVLKFKVMSARFRERVRPSDDDVLRAYRQMVRSSRSSDTFEAAQILIRVPQGVSALEVQRLEERADAVARRARDGEDFAQLARDFSDDPESAARGGTLGTLTHADLPPTLDDELVMLEVGGIAGPVRGPDGFYVLKMVSGNITGVRAFDDVRRSIEGRLMQDMMNRQEEVFLQNLRRRTYIDSRLE